VLPFRHVNAEDGQMDVLKFSITQVTDDVMHRLCMTLKVGRVAPRAPFRGRIKRGARGSTRPANFRQGLGGSDYDSGDLFRAHRMIVDWSDVAT
jgi:hypothetical protein